MRRAVSPANAKAGKDAGAPRVLHLMSVSTRGDLLSDAQAPGALYRLQRLHLREDLIGDGRIDADHH